MNLKAAKHRLVVQQIPFKNTGRVFQEISALAPFGRGGGNHPHWVCRVLDIGPDPTHRLTDIKKGDYILVEGMNLQVVPKSREKYDGEIIGTPMAAAVLGTYGKKKPEGLE